MQFSLRFPQLWLIKGNLLKQDELINHVPVWESKNAAQWTAFA
jgi:hypothetical protein